MLDTAWSGHVVRCRRLSNLSLPDLMCKMQRSWASQLAVVDDDMDCSIPANQNKLKPRYSSHPLHHHTTILLSISKNIHQVKSSQTNNKPTHPHPSQPSLPIPPCPPSPTPRSVPLPTPPCRRHPLRHHRPQPSPAQTPLPSSSSSSSLSAPHSPPSPVPPLITLCIRHP